MNEWLILNGFFNVGKYTIFYGNPMGFSGSITCTYTTPEVDPKGWWNCVITTFPPKPNGNLKPQDLQHISLRIQGVHWCSPILKRKLAGGTSTSLPNTVRFIHLSTQLILLRRKKTRYRKKTRQKNRLESTDNLFLNPRKMGQTTFFRIIYPNILTNFLRFLAATKPATCLGL